VAAEGEAAEQAAAKIKEIRAGKKDSQEGPTTLYKRLMRTVEDFWVEYPDASLLHVEGLVKLALKTVSSFRQHRS
jgi:hypothetical protein